MQNNAETTTKISSALSLSTLMWRYALTSFITHSLFISLSLVPGWRARPLLYSDAKTYARPAHNLVQHGVFSREDAPPYLWEPYRTPGYPLLVSVSVGLFGTERWALFFAAITAGLAALTAVRLTENWGGDRYAQHFAGLCVALLPNSLGLSARLFTDAIFGHLVLVWLFLTISAVSNFRLASFCGSQGLLWCLQAIKPTFHISAMLLIWIGLQYCRSGRKWLVILVLIALTVPVPFYFGMRNLKDHDISSPTLLGMDTLREYLQARHIAELTNERYLDVREEIHKVDHHDAGNLQSPDSYYGRLYSVRRSKVREFLHSHPWAVPRLMVSEAARQLVAPQEYLVWMFVEKLPFGIRAAGGVLNLLFWACVALGSYHLGREGNWQPSLTVLGVLGFFLFTGSISHLVGARLRFPADMVAIPLAAVGLSLALRQLKLVGGNTPTGDA